MQGALLNLTAGSVQLQSDDIELQKSLTLFSVIQRLYKGSAGNSIPIFTN